MTAWISWTGMGDGRGGGEPVGEHARLAFGRPAGRPLLHDLDGDLAPVDVLVAQITDRVEPALRLVVAGDRPPGGAVVGPGIAPLHVVDARQLEVDDVAEGGNIDGEVLRATDGQVEIETSDGPVGGLVARSGSGSSVAQYQASKAASRALGRAG